MTAKTNNTMAKIRTLAFNALATSACRVTITDVMAGQNSGARNAMAHDSAAFRPKPGLLRN
jgi:hypothetical protein